SSSVQLWKSTFRKYYQREMANTLSGSVNELSRMKSIMIRHNTEI
ncbi:MAG: hypothetical protein ACI8Q1_003338, partial [Parvicella sp.]